MPDFTFDLLFQLLPSALLLAGAVVLPLLYTRVLRRVLERLHNHLT